MGTVVLTWEARHRLHHDRPPPAEYTDDMKRTYLRNERWHPDCPFCQASGRAKVKSIEELHRRDRVILLHRALGQMDVRRARRAVGDFVQRTGRDPALVVLSEGHFRQIQDEVLGVDEDGTRGTANFRLDGVEFTIEPILRINERPSVVD